MLFLSSHKISVSIPFYWNILQVFKLCSERVSQLKPVSYHSTTTTPHPTILLQEVMTLQVLRERWEFTLWGQTRIPRTNKHAWGRETLAWKFIWWTTMGQRVCGWVCVSEREKTGKRKIGIPKVWSSHFREKVNKSVIEIKRRFIKEVKSTNTNICPITHGYTQHQNSCTNALL